MSDDSKNLSRVEDILSGEDYIPTKPMSRIEKLLLEGGGPGGKLPEVTSDDNGKILKVKDGAWDKGEDISGDKLPQVSSSDNGKVLKVVQGEWNIDKDEGDRLPVITPTDNDKILTAFGGQWIAKPDRVPSAQDCVEGSVLVARNNGWNGEQLPEVNAVPTPTSSDIGKVLKAVDEGEYDWENGTDIIQTTQESYDAMSTSQKMNGKLYFVHDESDDEDTAIYFMNKRYSKVPVDDVKQTPTNDGVYDILLSSSAAGSAEATEGAKKSSTHPLKYSTHGGILSIGDGDTNSGGVSLGWVGSPNVTVERTNQTTGAKNWIEMGLHDIEFNSNTSGTPDTWDGTHTSLKDALAAAAGAGGSEAVYLPLADYEELTTAEKEDPTKIYFVINEGTKVGPVLSGVDSRISQSSQSGAGSAGWKAFDGVKDTDNHVDHSWQPWGKNGGEWISCSFDTAQSFSKIVIDAMIHMNTGASNTFTYWVEGSNDGEKWDNILLNGETLTITYNGSGYTNWKEDTILLNCPKKYNKIRLRMDKSIGYQYSSCSYYLTEFEIYAAAASNKPSIYYKNVLYNPDELPTTTISDAGKVLKVNEDGLWDKGDAPIPNINSVQVPPVIFDNGSLKKINDVDGFPGLEKIYTTPTKYNALSDDEKNDLSKIYYVSDYEFKSYEDGKIVVRTDLNSNVLFFFNGIVQINGVPLTLPSGLEKYVSGYPDTTAYASDGVTSVGYLGINLSGDNTKYFVQAGRHQGNMINDVPTYAVINPTGGYGQELPYTNPYDVSNGFTIYYGGKQYSEYEPAKPYVELTQAEYDALPSSKESDGIIYFING